MRTKIFSIEVFCIIFISIILAFFFLTYLRIPSFTILNHQFEFPFFNFIILFTAIFFIFIIFEFLFQKLIIPFNRNKIKTVLSFSPFIFLLLFPLVLKFYITNDDLLSRFRFFIFLILFSFLYLKIALLLGYSKKNFFKKLLDIFLSLPDRKKIIILFLFSWLIYVVCAGILISKGIYFSGDEPHYLLITHSLLKDRDINLANNYQNRDYKNYIPQKIKLRPHGRFGKRGPKFIYSIHLPGISFLLIPLYFIGLILKGKTILFILRAGMGIFGALFGIQFYLFSKEHFNNEKKTILVWAIYSFTIPILFYSIHIYPEIIIALFSLFIFRKIYSRNKISNKQLVFLGLILSTFLWFGVKYNLLFFLFLALGVYLIIKNHKAGFRIIYFLIFPLISYLLFLWFLHYLYGTFTPLSVYEGPISSQYVKDYYKMVLTDIPLSQRIESLLNYFLDQRDGLLLYSPIYFFSFLGFFELLKRKKQLVFSLLFISLPYILGYAFLTQRGGYAPQARPLIAVFWVIGIFLVSFFIYNKKNFFNFLAYIGTIISIVVIILILKDPHALYQPTTHEITIREGRLFLTNFNNLHFSLTSFLPSFIKIDNSGYLPNYLWAGFLLIFIISYIFWKKELFPKNNYLMHVISINLLIIFLFFVKILYPNLVLREPRIIDNFNGRKIAFYSLSREAQFLPPSTFYLRRTGEFLFSFTVRKPFENLKFSFGSGVGKYKVRLNFFDLKLFDGTLYREIKEINLNNIPSYSFRHLKLYLIKIYINKLSPEPVEKNPFYFHFFPFDE